jgi:hypothetical protein
MSSNDPKKPELLHTEPISAAESNINMSLVETEISDEIDSEAKLAVHRTSFSLLGKPLFSTFNEGVVERHTRSDIEEKNHKRSFELERATKQFRLITLIIILFFVGAMTVFLVNTDKELYERVLDKLLPFLLGLVGGLGGGYGLKAYQMRDDQS